MATLNRTKHRERYSNVELVSGDIRCGAMRSDTVLDFSIGIKDEESGYCFTLHMSKEEFLRVKKYVEGTGWLGEESSNDEEEQRIYEQELKSFLDKERSSV